MVVGAGAAFSDQSKIKNTEAVDACTALNIIGGYPDGSFKPEGNITRAEVTKMICVALNGGKNPAVSTNTTPTFSDVRNNANAAWAEGYIESCAAQGIVSGVGGGKFAPNGNVTGVQLAKMLLVSLGYNSDTEKFTGNAWATNVNVLATQKGLYKGLEKMDVSAALTRDNAAQMIWNALQATEVEYRYTLDGSNGNLSSKAQVVDKTHREAGTDVDSTLLWDKYGAYVNVGTLVSVDGEDLKIAMSTADKADSDTYNDSFTKLSNDYSSLLGQKVKVIFKKSNNVLGVYSTEDNTIYNTVVNAIEKDGTKVKFDGNSYSVENEGIVVYVDGNPITQTTGSGNNTVTTNKKIDLANFDDAVGTKIVTSLASDNCQSPNFIKFVDSDDNGKIDTALITTVTIAKVTYVSSKEIIAGNVSYKYDDENIAKDIAKDDYVVITNNLFDECKDVVKAEKLSNVSLSGKKVNPDKYQLDGKWYVAAANAVMNSVVAGNKVDAWVYNGVVAYAKRTAGEAGNVGNVCVIKAIGSNIEGDKVKIVDFNDKESIVAYDTEDHSSDGYVAPNELKIGAAYEYEIVKNEYRFKPLNLNDDWYGDYTAKSTGSVATAVNAGGLTVASDRSGKVEKIDGVKVNDNAKVILVDTLSSSQSTTTDTKVITGKQLKSLTVGTATNNVYAAGGIAAFTSKVDGLTQVTYAVVGVNSVASSFTTNDNYAYITDSAYVSSTGYITYKMWNGTKEVTVTEKKSNTNNRAEGTVIGYSSIDADGEIQDVTTTIGATAGAIQGVNDKQTKVTFDGSAQFDITSDTVILYVDTDAHEGKTSGSIVEADKFGDAYINNVIYKTDGTDEVELLVVDVKNKLYGDVTLNSATAADINAALISGDVTVSGTVSGTISVPANTTLTLADAQNIAALEAITGTAGAKLVIKESSDSYSAASTKFFTAVGTAVANGAKIPAGTYVSNGTQWVKQ